MDSEIKLFVIRRKNETNQTLGRFLIFKVFEIIGQYFCLELPEKGNQNSISAIPEGNYLVKKRYTEKRGWHFHVQNVEGRTWILIHKGVYYTHTEGCMLPGLSLADFNNDGVKDVANSGKALQEMLDKLPDEFYMRVTS